MANVKRGSPMYESGRVSPQTLGGAAVSAAGLGCVARHELLIKLVSLCRCQACFHSHKYSLLLLLPLSLLLLQFLVLGWAVSQRDLELLIKLVGQLISSAAADGGATIVVLTQREKLEMEELFRWAKNQIIPLTLQQKMKTLRKRQKKQSNRSSQP
jgi:hypothetical protein